jgi:hypothetical protein
MFHIMGFLGGLSLVIFGVHANTKTQSHLRSKLLKKYILIYLLLVGIANFIIIPIFSLIK